MFVDPDKRIGEVEQRVRVIMSPLHFKLFVAVAAQNIRGCEERFGPIVVPTGGGMTAEIDGKAVPIHEVE